MKYQIIIAYKNGSSIYLDVPENYYQAKYSKKTEEKIHNIFMKEFKSFKAALNKKNNSMVEVGDYLKFSNATVSSSNILGVDLKTVDELSRVQINNSPVGGSNLPTGNLTLELKDDSLIKLIEKLNNSKVIEYLESFLQSKIKVEESPKKKTSSTTKKALLENK